MAHKKDLRLEVRACNAVLWHAIYDHWPTAVAFCAKYQVSYQLTCRLLRLCDSPLNKAGEFRPVCTALSQILGIAPDALFPLWLYELEKTSFAREYSFLELPAADQLRLKLPAPKDPYEAALQEELAVAVRKAIEELQPRYRAVLGLLFEGDGGDGMNLDDAAKKMGLSTERIRQLKLKGLAMLSMRLKYVWSRDHLLELISRRIHRTQKGLCAKPFTHRVSHQILGKAPVTLINLGEQYRNTVIRMGKLDFQPLQYDASKRRTQVLIL